MGFHGGALDRLPGPRRNEERHARGGIWLGVLACFWLTMGATFLINYITNQRSHAVLVELEALKQSVRELQKLVEARRD